MAQDPGAEPLPASPTWACVAKRPGVVGTDMHGSSSPASPCLAAAGSPGEASAPLHPPPLRALRPGQQEEGLQEENLRSQLDQPLFQLAP